MFPPNMPHLFADRMMTVWHVSAPYHHMAFKIEVKANQKTKVKKASEELNDHGRKDVSINNQLKDIKVITMLSGTSQCGINQRVAVRETKHAQM